MKISKLSDDINITINEDQQNKTYFFLNFKNNDKNLKSSTISLVIFTNITFITIILLKTYNITNFNNVE